MICYKIVKKLGHINCLREARGRYFSTNVGYYATNFSAFRRSIGNGSADWYNPLSKQEFDDWIISMTEVQEYYKCSERIQIPKNPNTEMFVFSSVDECKRFLNPDKDCSFDHPNDMNWHEIWKCECLDPKFILPVGCLHLKHDIDDFWKTMNQYRNLRGSLSNQQMWDELKPFLIQKYNLWAPFVALSTKELRFIEEEIIV